MNVNDVIRRVTSIFGDTHQVQIKQSDLLDWINDAQMEIIRQTNCYQTSLEESVTGFDWKMTLPADYFKSTRCTYVATGNDVAIPLTRTSLEKLDDVPVNTGASGSVPKVYYIWDNTLHVYPTVSSGAVKHFFVQKPPEITVVADPLVVPSEFHEDIVRFCLLRAHELNENESAARAVGAQFEGRMINTREDALNPEADKFPTIRDDPKDLWW